MSYLYFSNNLKDIKTPYIGLYDKFQNLFLISGNSFQREHKFIAISLFLCSSIMFLFETLIISNQISEILEPFSDIFIITRNVFSYLIDFLVQTKKSLENFITIMHDVKNTLAR